MSNSLSDNAGVCISLVQTLWNCAFKLATSVSMLLSRVLLWLYMGVGSISGFIEHLQIVTINNYSANVNHTLCSTVSSQSAMCSLVVAWWRIRTMCSASPLTFLLAGDCLTANSQAGGRLTPTSYSSHCCLKTRLSQSQSHIATDGQSVSKS
jgi:hypothetical protein